MPAAKSATETKPAPLPPPIVFFIAKGEPNVCGLGCREWIAAEGTIDVGADDRLRALLKKLGGRKLPIFFHSPGGSMPTGLAIGRLLRERGLTAGVGWTVPVGCDSQIPREEACDKLKRSGRELVAELDTVRSGCNSACVYALVGAVVRDVGAGARLGVHSMSVSFSIRRTYANGHVIRMPTRVAPAVEHKVLQGGYERIAAYLREMGIGQGLLAAAREISHDRVRFLTRDEIAAFGIDRREVVEGAWWFTDQPSSAIAVKVIETKDAEAGAFRRTILRLFCETSLSLRFQYGREGGIEKASLLVRVRVTPSGGHFLLGRGVTVPQSGNPLPLEVRSTDLPMSVLADEAFVIEAAGPSNAAASTATDSGFAKVTAQNLGPGLGALARRCGALPFSKPRPQSGRT